MSKYNKEELSILVNIDKLSYEEIGRIYGVSGAAIKKAAIRLGIDLPQRRKINSNETFNKGKKLVDRNIGICMNCGAEFVKYTSSMNKFCSHVCDMEYRRKDIINKWLKGEISGLTKYMKLHDAIRKYVLQEKGERCEKCGWSEVNPYSGNIPIQIHHIDGDVSNNRLDNLQVLCPNCHSLTDNFGSLNKNSKRTYRKDFYKKKYYE